MYRSILLSILVAASITQAGLQFEARISNPGNGETKTSGYVDGERAKIDFREGMPSAEGMAGYLITQDGGKTLYLVDPQEKTYIKFNPAQMSDTASTMLQASQGMVQIDIRNPSVKKLSETQGPDMLGYKTRHIKLQTSYTLETSVLGRTTSMGTDQTDEMWVTDKLHAPGWSIWLQQSSIYTGSEELDKLIELEQSRINGFPLKIISTRTETQNGKDPQTTTTTYEITSIRERNLPAAIFEIPADYTDGMASARREMERALESIENQATNPAAREAVNSLIRGFMER